MTLRTHQLEILEVMKHTSKGQIIVPTGGGKTLCMIKDAERILFNLGTRGDKTIVIVAPRILLAEQLSEEFLKIIKNVSVLHVHSGETDHKSTTKIEDIYYWNKGTKGHKLVFTTYHSLRRVRESNIDVDTIYFDESHNATQINFVKEVEFFSNNTTRCYFFTATPKHSLSPNKVGMNFEPIFGKEIVSVPAPDLIKQGYIIPPKVQSVKYSNHYGDTHVRDNETLINILKNEDNMEKVLVTAKSTRDISNLITQTDFQLKCHSLKYNVLWITSKFGAIINGVKVSRDKFFKIMNEWGANPDKKFIMFHHSILSEGISVSGLTSCILMRNLDYITMSQTIGRVIRLHKVDIKNIDSGNLKPCDFDGYKKPFGKMFIPVYNNVGISTERRLQTVVDTIFNKGEPAVSVVRK